MDDVVGRVHVIISPIVVVCIVFVDRLGGANTRERSDLGPWNGKIASKLFKNGIITF